MRPSGEVKAAIVAAHGKDSASMLADRYGLTRNQVIGIWHRRLRDSTEAPAATKAVASDAGTAPATRVPAAPPRPIIPIGGIPGLTGAALAVESLKPRCCRWPIGETGTEAFHFCCAAVEKPVVAGPGGIERPNGYCEEHRAAAKGARQTTPVQPGPSAAAVRSAGTRRSAA